MLREIKSFKYLGHQNELNIRNDIRTREAKRKRKLNEELTYPTGTTSGLHSCYKDESLKVIQLEPVP